MQLTLVRGDAIERFSLPEKRTGQYWVTWVVPGGAVQNLISVEGIDNDWVLKSGKTAAVLDADGERLRDVALEPDRFYDLLVESTGQRLLLRSEPSTDDRRKFSKWLLPKEGRLAIGRANGSDILFASRFVSSRHAEIAVTEDALWLTDLDSSNGTFVNGCRVSQIQLVPGDAISVIGLTIVVGKGFVAVNNPDGLVALNQAVLKPMPLQLVEPIPDEEIEESSPGIEFFRSPRFKRDITPVEIKIDSPPQRMDPDEMPLIMMIGPAMTMGMAALFTGIFALNRALSADGSIASALPTMVMSFSMLGGTVLWPILSRRYQKRAKIRREAARKEKYEAYVVRMRSEIEAEKRRQTEILLANIATTEDCVRRIRGRDRDLWERTVGHNDFLRIRLGVGDWPLDADIKYAERRFTVDEDELLEGMYALAEEPRILRDVPVAVSLRDQPIAGMIGVREETTDLVEGVIFQLAALHSYDELKLVFIYSEIESSRWDFVRWLPHVWSDDKSLRFVATSSAEVKDMSAYLEREWAKREGVSNDEELAEVVPHYVVVALDRDLAGKCELISRMLKSKKGRGFSLIAVYDELRNLPKECRAVIEIDRERSRIYDKDDVTGEYTAFSPDVELNQESPRDLAVWLGETVLDQAESAYALPDVITFLEMFEVGRIEHLNPLTRWKENNPVPSLEAPVGVGGGGELFKLDLHEKHHGPHGLIAGMTGSGKSEFIMAYILALAVNYHPDEVAFVLIDYKGGGMANSFADLPHVAGTITNLDGAAVNRSLVSIQSELRRRQAVFNAAGEKTGTSNIDIYKYQSLYREGAVDEPLPHLLIISDEFAELKTQQPEFMAQLVSAARIGRSLGVHLILATQKPSGVVDDQIWSNSRFRVCLKVQEKADSMEVIKRPDAAELTKTGRFYLQVGFNELFDLGQSAWAGAPYYPSDRVEKTYDNSVVLLNELGQSVKQAKLDKRKAMFEDPPKQLDAITKHIVHLAAEEGVAARPLWLDPVSPDISIDELRERYASHVDEPFYLDPIIGEFDDPANQSQNLVTVPLSEDGNVVVYGSPGSGKSGFLFSLIYSLMETHTPDEVNLYLLDFASETLRSCQHAPHIGDVVFSHEAEKIENLFNMLSGEVNRRKKLFADYGGDYRSYRHETGNGLPAIVVAIHNYAAFTELYDDKEETLASLTREGTRYGIYFVVTAASTSAVRYRILQNFKQMFVLQLNDPTEYSAVLGSTGGVVPSSLEGRGIFKTTEVYEFQTAKISSDPGNDLAFMRAYCAGAADQWTGTKAKRIPILPDLVTPEYLEEEIRASKPGMIPVGIARSSLEPVYWDMRGQFINLVLSRANESAAFAQGVAEALALQLGNQVVVLDADEMFTGGDFGPYVYRRGRAECSEQVAILFDEMVRRNNAAADAREADGQPPVEIETVYVVPSVSGLLGGLTGDEKDKFGAMLEKCDESLGTSFVFADTAPSQSTLAYEAWAKKHLTNGTGVWLGDGLTDQYILQPAKTATDMYQEIGSDFGWVLERGRARLVKLLHSDSDSESGDDLE